MRNEKSTVIKVIGIGTAGGIIMEYMIKSQIYGAEYIAVNTDQNILDISTAPTKILLSSDIRKLDAVSYQSSESIQESIKDIKASIEGSDAVIVLAGFGGLTGTFGTYLVAEAAISLGIVTIGVVITPFTFEGSTRRVRAEAAIARLGELEDLGNILIFFPNDQLCLLGSFEKDILSLYRAGDVLITGFISNIINIITDNCFTETDLEEIDWDSEFNNVVSSHYPDI